MIFSLVLSGVQFISTSDEFYSMSSENENYLISNITLSGAEPLDFHNSFLDCRNLYINSDTQVFNTISMSHIRNCHFAIKVGFATNVENFTFTAGEIWFTAKTT